MRFRLVPKSPAFDVLVLL